jgi:hypothetical protein
MKKKSYKIVAEKFEGKKPFGRTRCRWEDKRKMDFKDVLNGVVY